MTEREFDLGDVLSVTTGKLVSPRHIGGVYDVLGFMTGETLMTHQLPRACDQAKPEVLRQHPDLDIEVPSGLNSEEEVLGWLATAKAVYGATRTLTPLDPPPAPRDPIEEACDLVGAEKVYVFPEVAP